MTTPIVYDGQHYPSRRALARELAAASGRSFASVENMISTCRGDAEAIRRRLCTRPAPETAIPAGIPTVYAGQTFASRRALIRHLADRLGLSFDLVHARFYALKGDADAVVNQFNRKPVPGGEQGDAGNGFSNGNDGLAAQLAPLFDLMLDIGAALERLAGDVSKSAEERRRIGERLDQLLRAQTETRRALGQVELHRPTQHTRRRPLGAV